MLSFFVHKEADMSHESLFSFNAFSVEHLHVCCALCALMSAAEPAWSWFSALQSVRLWHASLLITLLHVARLFLFHLCAYVCVLMPAFPHIMCCSSGRISFPVGAWKGNGLLRKEHKHDYISIECVCMNGAWFRCPAAWARNEFIDLPCGCFSCGSSAPMLHLTLDREYYLLGNAAALRRKRCKFHETCYYWRRS